MNPTRRALCGLGLASVPLAMIGPRVFSAEQGPAGTPDSFLTYLLEDTKRNCRLASVPGRERAHAFRRLGANAEVLTAFVLSRAPAAGIKGAVERRVGEEGVDALALRLRDAWPGRASVIGRDYGVALPQHLDHQTVTAAIENVRRYGCPRLGGVRRWFDREADRIEQWEGRPNAPVLIRQTPGNDFGPPGWSAGLGDGAQMSCWDLGVIIAALYLLTEIVPDLQLGAILGVLGLVYTVVCNPLNV